MPLGILLHGHSAALLLVYDQLGVVCPLSVTLNCLREILIIIILGVLHFLIDYRFIICRRHRL